MLYALWEIVLPLVFALLVGMCIGWLIWGWRRSAYSRRSEAQAALSAVDDVETATATEASNAGERQRDVDPVPTLVGDAHPFGEGSHAPFSDRSAPEGFSIKGNVDSMLYHRPDSRSYAVTIAEVWFDTPERAEAAGFRKSPGHPTEPSTD